MDLDRHELLTELLDALFRSSDELNRFLVLEGIDVNPTRNLNVSERQPSKTADAYSVARSLIAQDLADDQLFASLERRSPGRGEDIRRVAELFREADAYPGSGTSPGDEPSPYADFAARLSASLSALPATDDGERALEPQRWPWAAAASVLGSFAPLELRPLDDSSAMSSLTALRDLVTANHHGSWVLRDEPRAACLERLVDGPQLGAALDANRHVPDRRRDFIDELLRIDPPSLPTMARAELVDLDAVLGWLAPMVPSLPVTRADVRAAAERRLLIDPLRSLVGTHFRGRAEELALLEEHLAGDTDDQVLLLRGAGGSGKSTLLGHVILELEQRDSTDRKPFAYIDFDKTRHDPRDRTALLRALAQQLRLLYATSPEAETFAAFESAYGGTDAPRTAEILDIDFDIDLDTDADRLLDTLCERVLAARHSRDRSPPLLLFLDTFEEVACEGPGAVRDVGELLGSLLRRLPDMRAVVAGRTVPATLAKRSLYRELTDLDQVAADAVLEHLGVEQPAVRHMVFESFGGNPLTLHLAADAIERAGGASEAFGDVVPVSRALVDTALEQVQGMLYSRILGHIKDPEVASVAHPGLAVRLVTVDVLRQVIAGPVGIDPARVEEVFAKLHGELSLFEVQDDGSLRHRPDVRRIMLRAMSDDPKRGAEVADIHGRAVAYYQGRQGEAARTEELYHRLMADEDPRTLDPLWRDSMIASMSSAIDEPLSPRARRWLGRRVDLGAPEADMADWEQEDWEANAYTRAASWLASHDPASALEVLGERSARLTPSRLSALEVAALLQLGQVDAAATALEEGMQRNRVGQDDEVSIALGEQAVAVRAAQGDAAGLASAGLGCATAAELAGEPARGIRALAATATELERMGDREHLLALRGELVRRFEQLDRQQMRDDPELVRHVLHAVGAEDASVLNHAVVNVGDQTDEEDGVFVGDTFALARLLDGTTAEAGPALAALAESVGLRPTGWKTEQLASLLVRTGRTALGITLGLDFASDKKANQALVVDELVQLASETWRRHP